MSISKIVSFLASLKGSLLLIFVEEPNAHASQDLIASSLASSKPVVDLIVFIRYSKLK
jgi:hypothetical protein